MQRNSYPSRSVIHRPPVVKAIDRGDREDRDRCTNHRDLASAISIASEPTPSIVSGNNDDSKSRASSVK